MIGRGALMPASWPRGNRQPGFITVCILHTQCLIPNMSHGKMAGDSKVSQTSRHLQTSEELLAPAHTHHTIIWLCTLLAHSEPATSTLRISWVLLPLVGIPVRLTSDPTRLLPCRIFACATPSMVLRLVPRYNLRIQSIVLNIHAMR